MAYNFFVVILAALFIGCSSQQDTPQNEVPNSTTTTIEKKKSYALNKRELLLLDNIVKFEKKALMSGAKTMLMSSIPAYTSAEIANIYEDNQTAGDQKFLNKSFIVRGDIAKTISGTGNDPYVTLYGSNPVSGPQVHFQKFLLRKIAALKKGQAAAFACNGGGFAAGAAMFNDCLPIEDYSFIASDKFKKGILRFLNGEPVNQKDVPLSAVLIIALARVLPENATCFSTGENCEQEIMEQSTQEKLKQQAPSVKDELVAMGLKILL